jgi:hypothetical protein
MYTGIVQTAIKSGKCRPLGDYPASKPVHEESIMCRYLLDRARQCVVGSRRVKFVKMDRTITFNNSSLYVVFILFILALKNATSGTTKP